MTPDLFSAADQRRREKQLEAKIDELELIIADFMSVTADLWNVQARGVRYRAKVAVPHFQIKRRKAA